MLCSFGNHYSANYVDEATGKPALPPYHVEHVEHVDNGAGGAIPMGFVHATVADTLGGGLTQAPFNVRDTRGSRLSATSGIR